MICRVMANPQLRDDYAWWKIELFVTGINYKRRRYLAAGQWKVLDELMSQYRPRTRKTGNLPNISYILRKPKPLGTEFKCVACAKTGIMLGIEVQEGKNNMAMVSSIVQFFVTDCSLTLILYNRKNM